MVFIFFLKSTIYVVQLSVFFGVVSQTPRKLNGKMGVDGIIIIGIDSTERVFDDEMPSDGSETFELSLFKKRKEKKKRY